MKIDCRVSQLRVRVLVELEKTGQTLVRAGPPLLATYDLDDPTPSTMLARLHAQPAARTGRGVRRTDPLTFRNVTTYGAVSFGFHAVGLALVVVGLYRRDTEAQRWLRALRGRARSWLRRLLRRGATVHVGSASSTVTVGTKARGSVRPGPRNPDAPMGERVAWLEHDVAFRELDSERQWTNDDVRDIREGLRGLTSELRQAVARLGRELDEVRAPERLEWWGAGVVAVGLAFAVIDVATAATQSGAAG